MATRTFGRTNVSLPEIDDDMYLGTASNLNRPGHAVSEFRYVDQELRDLEIIETDLRNGRVRRLNADRVSFEGVRLSSVEFADCDMRTWQWVGSKVSRVVFRDCKLMGLSVSDVGFDHVLFEKCRLDLASFRQLRSTGPLVFSQCTLTEATFEACDLTDTVFADCRLHSVEFHRGKYQGCDLSTSDLSTVRGVGNLRGVVVERMQESQLATALLKELELTFTEDLPAPR
ncbi:pentapeptide repeat-containing protein [Kitasatospora acidiphila]|uniref:Pentapeptide repeat-containing protein n=1 Tax=Kitasatospora acidiphila TaxID=2567942 RepID=A0A540WET5_9ACTN|nr:pentapeptide repeat-containing protein [Kitasatospora acidiphila]TQF06914.1 pentapeptide repeat-containing protein [Kitasatospora acidiphila]